MENNQSTQETGFTTSFSPLEENVTQRDYTRANVRIEDVTPIEEPTFIKPSFEELDANFRQQLGEEDPSNNADPRRVIGQDEPVGSANPYTENLDSKDQRMASQAMVDAILDGYKSLKNYSNRFIQIPKKKIEKLIRSGEIDPNIMIPLSDNQSVPLMQYVDMYNAETEGTITMSDEFRENVSGPLLAELMKRNIGMTNLQQLGYYVTVDAAMTIMQVYGLMTQQNALIAQLKETTLANGFTPQARERNNPKPSAYADPTPEPFSEPAPAPRPSPSSAVEYFEPEEAPQPQTEKAESFTQFEVLEDLQPETSKTTRPKKSRAVKSQAMPTFGDAELLAHMENVAKTTSSRRKK